MVCEHDNTDPVVCDLRVDPLGESICCLHEQEFAIGINNPNPTLWKLFAKFSEKVNN